MPAPLINMIGKAFGKFVVIKKGDYVAKKRHWILQCQDCGYEKSLPGTDIRRAFKGEVCRGCIDKRCNCDDGYKCCPDCNKAKPFSKFFTNPHHSDGVSTKCKKCTIKCRKYLRNVVYRMVGTIKKKSKKEGWKTDINTAFVRQLNEKQKGKCAYTGLDLSWEYKTVNHTKVIPFNRASLDRIDNTKGYTRDNVQLVAYMVNMMKRDYNEDLFIWVCKLIAKGKKKQIGKRPSEESQLYLRHFGVALNNRSKCHFLEAGKVAETQ